MNFSSVGWFGSTLAVDQRLQDPARTRALELERPMVRATNLQGHRAIIDRQWGWSRIRHGARFSRGVCVAKCTARRRWGVECERSHHASAWWKLRASGSWHGPLWLLAGLPIVA